MAQTATAPETSAVTTTYGQRFMPGPRALAMASTSIVPVPRNMARTIARPSPISAAARAMTNSVSTWPVCSVSANQAS